MSHPDTTSSPESQHTWTTLSPANARATRSRCSNAFTPFARPLPFACNARSCSSTSLCASSSSSSAPAPAAPAAFVSAFFCSALFCGDFDGPASACAPAAPRVMTSAIETSTAASSCARAFSSPRFCARLRSLWRALSASALPLPTATSCFFCAPRLPPSAPAASHGFGGAAGAAGGASARGSTGEAAAGEVGWLPLGMSVDLRVTLEVSEANDGSARESSGCDIWVNR